MLKHVTLIIFNTLTLTKSSRIGGYTQGPNDNIKITRSTNCEELFPAPNFPSISRVNCRERVSLDEQLNEKIKEKTSHFLKAKNLKKHRIEQVLENTIARQRPESRICDSGPCFNDGVCEDLNDGINFMCYCGHVFYGPLCEMHACFGEPCGAHGRCQLDVDDNYEFACSCEEGFSGKQCEIGDTENVSEQKCAYFDHNGECVV